MRQDIQILRALSVLSVIFYHFNKEVFPNGYLGVDIFFVISGYLITKNILDNIKNQNFSLKEFYFKRFKRIAPSLITSLVFTYIVGFFNYSSEDFFEMVRGIKYSIFFIGNLYFSQVIDYFQTDAEKNLLINLWSLGVEEQFYIIFPLIIILINRFKKNYFLVFFLFSILVSLTFNLKNVYLFFSLDKLFFQYENYIFYSPFTRAWQFLFGSLANVVNLKIKNNGLVKIFIILVCIYLFSNFSFFNQFILVLITFFVLLNVNKLEYKNFFIPLIHIGNISYSLYLFHQPIIAGIKNHNYYTTQFGKTYINLSNYVVVIGVFIIIYLVSLINYVLVENHYRKFKKYSFNSFKKILIVFGLFFLLIINSKSVYIEYYNIYQNNNKNFFTTKIGTNYLLDENNYLCVSKDTLQSACKFGNEKGQKIYFLGDSTVASIISAFINEENVKNYKIIDYTQAGCYPMVGECNFVEDMQYYIDVTSIKQSIIIFGGNKLIQELPKEKLKFTYSKLLENGNKIYFIGYIPVPGINEAMYLRKNQNYFSSYNHDYYLNQKLINEKFEKSFNDIVSQLVATKKEIYYIELFSEFCSKEYCNYFDNSGNYYFIDHAHLSYYGAKIVSDKFNFYFQNERSN